MSATAARARSLATGAYVVEGPGSVTAVPGRPEPEHAGAPALQLIGLGATTVVQAGFRWPIPEEAIRAVVPGLEIALTSAISDAPQVELVLHEEAGPRVLASAASSGYPPYSAVLSVTVDAATAATLQRALDGERGLVSVVYRAHAAGLPLVHAVLEESATHGVAIGQDRKVTATADVATWARRDNEQE